MLCLTQSFLFPCGLHVCPKLGLPKFPSYRQPAPSPPPSPTCTRIPSISVPCHFSCLSPAPPTYRSSLNIHQAAPAPPLKDLSSPSGSNCLGSTHPGLAPPALHLASFFLGPVQPSPISLGAPFSISLLPLSRHITEFILGPHPPLAMFPPPSLHSPPSSCHRSVEDTKCPLTPWLLVQTDSLPDIPLLMAHSHLKLNTSKTNPSPSLRTCSFPLSHSILPGDSASEPQSYREGVMLARHASRQSGARAKGPASRMADLPTSVLSHPCPWHEALLACHLSDEELPSPSPTRPAPTGSSVSLRVFVISLSLPP